MKRKERCETGLDLAFQGVKGKLVLMKTCTISTFEMTQCTVFIANLRKENTLGSELFFFLKTSFQKKGEDTL